MKAFLLVIFFVLVMFGIDIIAPIISPVVGPAMVLLMLAALSYVILDTVKNK